MVSLHFSLIAALDRSALLVHEHRAQPARGFVSTGPAPSDAELTLRIALNPSNIAGLESELYAVSDPSSSRYGQHLTPEDACPYIYSSDKQISATTISPAGDVLQFKIPTTHETTIRTLQYSLPGRTFRGGCIHSPHDDFSRPFAAPKSQPLPSNSKRDIDPTCADITTISCSAASATQTNNVLGVSAYDNEFANFNDPQGDSDRPDLPATTKFDPRHRLYGWCREWRPVKFISVGPLNNDTVSGFLDQINALISDPSRTYHMTLPVAQGLCNAYAQLGALGTSILFASGDGGVAGNEFECTTFVPTAPSTVPWVSPNYFEVPCISKGRRGRVYSSLGDTYSGLFNTTGRVNFVVVSGNRTGLVSGTSASSPVFASVIALTERRAHRGWGRAPSVFLNPFLYSPAGRAALNDVTDGKNPGCGTSGFNATVGWDPVTGLGSPNYPKLRTAVGLS
ncbi:family S53 protease-like protein [Mycena olivaceomarginata]|nr:family S53 protease-like protein [Mycena olivaceomarginata]